MTYEIVRTYDSRHVRCIQYDLPRIKKQPEFTELLPVIRTMAIGEYVYYSKVFNYQLLIERVS